MNLFGGSKIKFVFQSHIDKKQRRRSLRYGKPTIGKTDNVKTSSKRQVKAQISHSMLRSILLFLSLLLQTVNAAEQPVLSEAKRSRMDVDFIFVNGNIHTVNERQRHAEAIAVKNQRIVFVGSNEDAKKLAGDKTGTVDLRGQTVVPGMTESHCHIFGIGERELHLNLEGTNTREDFLAKVKERVAKTERGKWITGRGWIETFWKPPQFPTQQDLDAIAPDNPVFLTRADGHAAIANSAALVASTRTSDVIDA